MSISKLHRRTVLFSAAATLAAPLLAQTTNTPAGFANRPIRIVPFGAGGGPIDIIARVYGEKLQQRWGQAMVVDPKPGASGIIAADFVAKAAPDGHTVLITLPLTHVSNAILQAKLPYDPVKDFSPLSMLATGGPMIVARANAPYSTVKEFIEFAKQQKSMTYGTWGNGSSPHLYCELIKRQTGANLIHVPYRAEATLHTDLFGESLDFGWANPASARVHVQAGKMKVLGIASTRRVSTLPTVPTFAEQGFKGFDIDAWIGVYGPAKMPQPIVEAWVAALRDITAQTDISARLAGFGFEALGNNPSQFMDIYRADYPRMAELIKAAGVTAE